MGEAGAGEEVARQRIKMSANVVKMRRTLTEQNWSDIPQQADLNETCRYFAEGPLETTMRLNQT
jgi:hypothetical protein